MRNKEELKEFYDIALNKILSLKSDELTAKEFYQVKRCGRFKELFFKKNRNVSLEQFWVKRRMAES